MKKSTPVNQRVDFKRSIKSIIMFAVDVINVAILDFFLITACLTQSHLVFAGAFKVIFGFNIITAVHHRCNPKESKNRLHKVYS